MSLFFKVIGYILLPVALFVMGGEPSLEAIQAGRQWDALIWGIFLGIIGGICLWVGDRLDPQKTFFEE